MATCLAAAARPLADTFVEPSFVSKALNPALKRAPSFSSSPMAAEALSPDPVSTSTVSSCGRMTPAVRSRLRPAAATAEVGST